MQMFTRMQQLDGERLITKFKLHVSMNTLGHNKRRSCLHI